MKLVLTLYAGSTPSRISALLETEGVPGYTLLREAHGAGTTGRREGTRAWPGEGAVLFSVVEDAETAPLTARLRDAARSLPPGETLHVAVLPVECFA